MKRTIIIILTILVAACPVFAGTGISGAGFLKMGGGARARAMGDAYIAVAQDSSAVFWNPAGLVKLYYPEVQYMYNSWFVDISHQYFEAAFPTENGIFGGSYSLLDSGTIQGYDGTGGLTSTFTAQDTALTLSWARKMNNVVSLGINAKTITEKLEDHQALAMAADVGVMWILSPKFTVGAVTKNVGQSLKFIAEETPLPQFIGAGIAYRDRLGPDELTLAGDYVANSDGTGALNLGAEYLFRDLIALRFGSAAGGFRAGVGLWTNHYGLDYAYQAGDDLGTAHLISMSYSFGSRDRKKALVREYLALGKAFMAKDRYADAAVQLEKVLDLEAGNAEARALYNRASRAVEKGAEGQVSVEILSERKAEADKHIANGKKFVKEKQYLEAIGEFNKALKVMPSHPDAIKLVREAQAALEAEVSTKVKEEAREHLGLAMKYISTQDYDEAMREVQEVLKIDPGNVQALQLLKKLNNLKKLEIIEK